MRRSVLPTSSSTTRLIQHTNQFRGGSDENNLLSASSLDVAEALVHGEPLPIEPVTIPQETSITNNPAILCGGGMTEETSSQGLLQYLVPARSMIPELLGETFGTFLLLQLVLGILLPATFLPTALPGGVWPIAAMTGMGITIACAVVSSKCAAHFNPAITWSMCLYRKFGWHKLVPYSVCQLLGAFAASAWNFGLYAPFIKEFELANGLSRLSLQQGGVTMASAFACFFKAPVSPALAFISETFGAFVLSSVVFALTSSQNKQAEGLYIPPIIGSTVALIIAVLGPVSCASLNPARELGPRLALWLAGGFSGSVAFHQLGMYLLAPLLGATLGGLFVDKILYPQEPPVEVEHIKVY